MTAATYLEVVDEDRLSNRVAQLGAEISRDYEGRDPILICVLKGSMLFAADLVRHITVPMEIDFLALSRFGGTGRVGINMDVSVTLEHRHVIIIEDIVDTGLTLTALRRLLELRGVASLATVALIDKATRRIVDVPLEYRGFEVGDEFLLGYGLDWEGRYRNVGSVWAVMDLSVLTEDPMDFAPHAFAGSQPGAATGR